MTPREVFNLSLAMTSIVLPAIIAPFNLFIWCSFNFVSKPSFVFLADSIGPRFCSMNLANKNGEINPPSFGRM